MTALMPATTSTFRTPLMARLWPDVRRLVRNASSCAIATVNADGSPHVTPIGSVWLDRDTPTGFYLERFPTRLPENLDARQRFTLLVVDDGAFTWLNALVRGRFQRVVGARLSGWSEPARPATEHERSHFLKKVAPLRWTRGHKLLWRDMANLRPLHFDGLRPIPLGKMTKGTLG